MSKNNVIELEDRDAIVDPLTELVRKGAQRLIQQAMGAEFEELLARHAGRRTEAEPPRRGSSSHHQQESATPDCADYPG